MCLGSKTLTINKDSRTTRQKQQEPAGHRSPNLPDEQNVCASRKFREFNISQKSKIQSALRYLEYHQTPGGGGTNHSCYHWQEADLWRSIQGQEEGEEAGGSHRPPDRAEKTQLNANGVDIMAECDNWWSYC